MVFPPFYGDLVSTSPSATVWAPSGMPPQPAAAASSAASAFVGLIDARSRLYINRKLDQPTELLKVATPAVADEILGDIKQLPASYKISGYTQVQVHIVSASAAQVGLHACLDDSGVHWVDTATGNRIDWQYRNGTWRLAVDAVVTPGAGPDRWLVSTLDIPGETC